MRIASLLPSATEIVCALGLRDQLVAVSHSCDRPESITGLPVLTRSIIDPTLSPAEVDRAVSAAVREGRALYSVQAELLDELRPELIVTQGVCEVCAVTPRTVQEAVRYLPDCLPVNGQLLSLEGRDLTGILADVRAVAAAVGLSERGEALVQEAEARWNAVQPVSHAPTVLTLEWTDPPFFGGHWVPQQVERAGGRNAFGQTGQDSGRVRWSDIVAADPDVTVVMCCGYGLSENAGFARTLLDHPEARGLRAVQGGQLWAVDANASFSRPSLGVVRGAEVLAQLLRGNELPGESLRIA